MEHTEQMEEQPPPIVLRTDADVTDMWRRIIKPLGWARPQLYVALVGTDRVVRRDLVAIDDPPHPFTRSEAAMLVALFAQIARADGLHDIAGFAVLLCRPGSTPLDAADRRACGLLYAAARERVVPLELVHVGNDLAITPVPMDDALPHSA